MKTCRANSLVISFVCFLGLRICAAHAENAALAGPNVPKMIINYGGHGWKEGQVQEPCILINPKDASKLVMFYSGMKLGGGEGSIGKASANQSNAKPAAAAPWRRYPCSRRGSDWSGMIYPRACVHHHNRSTRTFSILCGSTIARRPYRSRILSK